VFRGRRFRALTGGHRTAPTCSSPVGTFRIGKRAARSIPERWPADPAGGHEVFRFKAIDARKRTSTTSRWSSENPRTTKAQHASSPRSTHGGRAEAARRRPKQVEEQDFTMAAFAKSWRRE
jgi:hypothetical protein